MKDVKREKRRVMKVNRDEGRGAKGWKKKRGWQQFIVSEGCAKGGYGLRMRK